MTLDAHGEFRFNFATPYFSSRPIWFLLFTSYQPVSIREDDTRLLSFLCFILSLLCFIFMAATLSYSLEEETLSAYWPKENEKEREQNKQQKLRERRKASDRWENLLEEKNKWERTRANRNRCLREWSNFSPACNNVTLLPWCSSLYRSITSYLSSEYWDTLRHCTRRRERVVLEPV